MISNASVFLALRYLRPKRSFVSIITLISVMGVMLGVGVLVVVMSIFKGWQVEFRQLLLGFEPHMVLVQEANMPVHLTSESAFPGPVRDAGAPTFAPPPVQRSNWRDVLAEIKKYPGVVSAMPMAEGVIVARAGDGDPEAVELFGLKPGPDNNLLKKLSRHRVDKKNEPFNLNDENIVITDKLAKKLGVKVGDTLEVYASDNIRQMIREVRNIEEESKPVEAYEDVTVIPKDLTITAIVRADTAGERCYAPLFVAQELFQLEDKVTGLEVEVTDPEHVDEFEDGLLQGEVLPMDWSTRIWSRTHGSMLQNVENQKSLMYFLLVFIMLVAAICVMNTIITVTVQKRREIGILTALGTSPNKIIGIFLTQAGIVAVLGLVSGLLGGMLVLFYRNDLREFIAAKTGRDFFPADIYFLSSIPSKIEMSDLVSVGVLAVALCLVAALIPAWFAAKVDPAVALRD